MKLILTFFVLTISPYIQSIQQLAYQHCKNFPLQKLLAVAQGRLSQLFGQQFIQIDFYLRKFLSQDNYYKQYHRNKQTQQPSESQSQSDPQQKQQQQQDQGLIEPDQLIPEYVQGLKKCKLNWTQKEVYQIWRLYRFILNHDYFEQFLRTKLRSSYGYQLLKKNSFLDMEYKSGQRFVLFKLYSIQELKQMEKIYFFDQIVPLFSAIKKMIVVAINGNYTKNGKSILYVNMQTLNTNPKLFYAYHMKFNYRSNQLNFFGITIPGIPLFICGKSDHFSWSFAGFLTDHTNNQQIEAVKGKYYDQIEQKWKKVENVTTKIFVRGRQQPEERYFYQTKYGPFYTYKITSTKFSFRIMKWRQSQLKVRRLFTDMLDIIANQQFPVNSKLFFPFTSLILTKDNDISIFVNQPSMPCYYIYPDMPNPPMKYNNYLINPAKGSIIVGNQRLSSDNLKTYVQNKQIKHSWIQQGIVNIVKGWKEQKVFPNNVADELKYIQNYILKKTGVRMIQFYRKYKFIYFPDKKKIENIDKIISELENYDYKFNPNNPQSNLFKIWLYFFKKNLFNYYSAYGNQIMINYVRYHVLSDNWLYNTLPLWNIVVSFGQCNSTEWTLQFQPNIGYTKKNSSCYYAILKALNQTVQVLEDIFGKQLTINKRMNFKNVLKKQKINLFQKNEIDKKKQLMNGIFSIFYNTNLQFVAGAGPEGYISLNGESMRWFSLYDDYDL